MNLSSADRQARSRFQSGLLAWLRAAGDASGLREMVAVVRGRALDDAPNALLWRSAEAFLQALLDGTLAPDDEARQLCRRLERQLARADAAAGRRELADALFAYVSNRTPRAPAPAGAGTATPAGEPRAPSDALKSTLGATAELLPLLALNQKPPRRFDDAQRARWTTAAGALDAAWQRLLTGRESDGRAAATGLVAVALELADPAGLQLAEALADAVGQAEEAAVREGAAFRAAVAAALEIAGAPDGPEQTAFDARVAQAVRRLRDNRAAPARPLLPGGPQPWFAEDAREWLHDLRAAIDAVPPKRLALVAGLEWLAQQDACRVMAVRGLATLALQVIRQVRADDLDQPDTHALLADTIAALDAAIGELAAGQPPRADEPVFARLRALDAGLTAQRQQLSAQKPSQ